MDGQEIVGLCLKHTMYSWSATGAVQPLPIVRAEGIYMYTASGQRILDFNSQLMSVNIGHSHPKVVAAMKRACDGLLFAHPGTATEPRARLSQAARRAHPGDLDASSIPWAAPRPTRTRSAPPRCSPAARRSCRATAATTVARTPPCN